MISTSSSPGYVKLLMEGRLSERVRRGQEMFFSCVSCGWRCKVDRHSQKLGVCMTGVYARVSSYGAHLGEENPLRGWRGSGTIFFSRCNLHCQFCQNHDISQADRGKLTQPGELAGIMLELQEYGCHNINLVSPTHVAAQILAAVEIAANNGLHLPLVWNTGGYDSLELLAILDGIVDIYMPDIKYANQATAQRYSKIPHYPQTNQAAVKEMHRQVGDLTIDQQGVARRGLLVRHLVLPGDLAGTETIMHFLAEEISPNTYVNIMDQYRPCWRADEYPGLNRKITAQEYLSAIHSAHVAGLNRLDRR